MWNPELERKLLAVRRPTHKQEILLIGMDKSVAYFEQHAGDDPQVMLLILAVPREAALSQAATTAVKARLMRQAWHPEFLRKQ